jgi:hypothetical protein
MPEMPSLREGNVAISGMPPGVPSSDGQMPGDISQISLMTVGASMEGMPNISMDGIPSM